MAINSFKQDEQTVTTKKSVLFRRLFRYLLAYKGSICIVCLILAVSTAISIINPLLMGMVVDDYIRPKDVSGLVSICLFAVALNILLIILIKLRMYIMAKVSNKILVTIRQELYTHIQLLSFDFFDSRPTGKILARIIGDVNSLKGVISDTVTTLLPDFLTILAVLFIMFAKNYKLALAGLSSMPLMVVLICFIQSASHKCWQIVRKKNSNMNAFIHENLSGIRIIQSFCAEEESNETFDSLIEEHRKAWVKAARFSNAFGPSIDLCWGIGSMMLYFFGIVVLGRNAISLGTYITFASYIGMFWNPVMNLSNYYNQLITNLSGAERIFEIIDTDPDIEDSSNACAIENITGDIVFDNVSFSYDKQFHVLDHLSFHIRPGETVALVGPTGAGKTTIVNLISRFYDLQEGDIRIDGRSLIDISLESLRSQMGVMTQDSYLFTGTIRDNILYGKLDATEEEVVEAAKAVHAHDFIMKLKDGYDTMLKERGGGLSVGQKQLIAFARTLLANPKILILDEATSSIDTKTERLIQKGIETLLSNRTAIVIAHRLSTIQNADRIFVIDDGGIVEEGTASDLLKKRGAYYNLYMAQIS